MRRPFKTARLWAKAGQRYLNFISALFYVQGLIREIAVGPWGERGRSLLAQ